MNDSDILELTELCNAIADERATPEQRLRFNAMLRESDDARAFYVRFAGLGASLCFYAGESQIERSVDAPNEVDVTDDAAHGQKRRFWFVTGFSLAAALLLTCTLWALAEWNSGYENGNGTAALAAPESDSIGWLTGARDAQWATGQSVQPGDDLPRGKRLELERGLAEIILDSGATVVIEGPAAVDLHSGWEVALQKGVITTSAPKEAAGFRVRNRDVDVTNLGGQFAVHADREGADVLTLAGRVEASPAKKPKDRVVLEGKDARRFGQGRVNPVVDLDRKMAKLEKQERPERKPRPANFVRWSFRGAKEMQWNAVASGIGPATLRLASAKNGGHSAPPLAATNTADWARALRLDGRAYEAQIPQKALEKARTLAFWLRVPKDASLQRQSSLVSMQWRGRGARVAYNTEPEVGTVGALRADTNAGRHLIAVGKTDLRDSQWHHVTVMILGPRKDGSVQLKQYVDGNLNGSGLLPPQRPQIKTNKGALFADFLRVGDGDPESATDTHGEMDDLYLGDRPLIPEEIRQLMNENRPPT